jgi:magnesium chelatase family protein
MALSARGYHRVLKVARTIADLAGADVLDRAHVAEALAYRSFDGAGRRA